MARVGTAGSPRPLLPVREDDNFGDVIIEIGSDTGLVDSRKHQGKQNLQLRAQVTEALNGTPEQDVFGHDVLGQPFVTTVWIDQQSSLLYDLLEAAGVDKDADGAWDTDDLHGVSVGVRYGHREYPKNSGEMQVDVKKFYPAE